MHLALCLVPSGFPRCYFSRPLPCLVCSSKYVACLPGVFPGRHPWLRNDKALCLQCTQGPVNPQGGYPPWESALIAFPQHPPSSSLVPRHSLNSPTLRIGILPLSFSWDYVCPQPFDWEIMLFPSVPPQPPVWHLTLKVLIKDNQMRLRPELDSCFHWLLDSVFQSSLVISNLSDGFLIHTLLLNPGTVHYLISSLLQPWEGNVITVPDLQVRKQILRCWKHLTPV